MHNMTNPTLIERVKSNPQATEAELELVGRLEAAIDEIDLLTTLLRGAAEANARLCGSEHSG